MSEQVARGVVDIELNSDVEAGLRRAEAEFEATMAKIEGREAEAKIGADLSELRRDLKVAEAELKAFDKKRADATATTERRSAAQFAANARKRRDALANEVAQTEAQAQAIKRANQQRDVGLQKQRAEAALSAKQTRLHAQNEAAIGRQNKLHDRGVRALQQQEAEVAKLQRSHANLEQQLAKIDRQRKSVTSRLGGTHTTKEKLDIDRNAVFLQMREIRARLEAMNAEPIEIHAHVDEPHTLHRWAQALGQTTTRIGPFTTSIAGLARAMVLLGPIVVGVAGTIGALSSALVGGIAGGAGVAATAVTGFGLAATGLFFALRPAVKSLGQAFKASTAYATAVDKYGKNSTQAKNAQKQLNNVLAAVPAQVRGQFQSLGRLNSEWQKLTEPSRLSFFRTAGEGIKTVSALMPQMAARTNQAANAIGTGLDQAFQGLRSTRGKQVLDTIFQGFNASIAPAMAGLNNLGAALGNVMESFAPHLKPLAEGFKNFTQNIENAVQPGTRLDNTVTNLVHAFQAIGHVAAGAGRVIMAFVGAGLRPGTDLLNRFADGMNKLAANMNTVAGQQKLGNFFRDSIDTTQRLYFALKPLAQLFLEFSTIMRPFTNIALSIVSPLASLLHTLLAFGAVKTVLTAAFGIFLASSLVGRILAAAGAIRTLVAAMAAMRLAAGGAGFAAGLKSILTTAGSTSAAAAGWNKLTTAIEGAGAGAVGAAASTERTAAAAEKVRAATTGAEASTSTFGRALQFLGRNAGRIAGVIGVGTVAVTSFLQASEEASSGTFKGFSQASDAVFTTVQAYKALDEIPLGRQVGPVAAGYRRLATAGTQAGLALQQSNVSLRQARTQLGQTKRGTDEHRVALLQYRQALLDQTNAEQEAGKVRTALSRQSDQQYRSAQKELEKFDEKHADSIRNLTEDARKTGRPSQTLIDELKQRAGFLREVTQATNRQAASDANATRALQGMVPVLGKAEQSLGRLARTSGGKAIEQKIAVKFEAPKDVGAVSRAAGAALRAGVKPKQVLNIVANSKSAEEAIKRINAAKIKAKIVAFRESGGARVISQLERISGKRLSAKQVRIIESGGPRAVSLLEHITGIKIPQKLARIISQGGPAAVAAIQRVIALKIAAKVARVTAQTGQAVSAISRVIGLLAGLHDKTVTATVNTVTHASGGGGKSKPGKQTGSAASGAVVTSAEKKAAKAAERQAVATHGGRYNRAAYVVGEENRTEYVIATNPMYRDRNVKYWLNAGADLGMLSDDVRQNVRDAQDMLGNAIPMYRKGKGAATKKARSKTKSDNAKQKAQQRAEDIKQAKHDIFVDIHHKGIDAKVDEFYNTDYGHRVGDDYGSVNSALWGVALGEQAIEHKTQEISYQESKLAQPDTFLRDTGRKTDSGDAILEIDEGAVSNWAGQLQTMATLYDQLVQLLQALSDQLDKAQHALDSAIFQANDQLAAAEYHLGKLTDIVQLKKNAGGQALRTNRDSGILDKIDLEKDRITAYKAAISDLNDDKGTVSDKLSAIEGIGGTKDVAAKTRDDYAAEAGAVMALANKELAGSVGAGGGGAGGGGGGAAANANQLTYGQQAAAVDVAQQGILQQYGGNAVPAIGTSMGSALGAVGMVQNAANLIQAGGYGGISGLGGGGTALGDRSGAMMASASVGGVGGASLPMGAISASGISPMVAAGGKSITVNNTFAAPPPDPHTWTKGMEFELGASV